MEDITEFLKDTSSTLSEVRRALGSVSGDSEWRFVKLGEDLQSVFSDSEVLERSAVETAGMIRGDADERLLSKTGDLAKDSLARLEGLRNEVTELYPRFESSKDQMNMLIERCPGIIKIAKTLRMVALNISTESSRSEDCEEMFGIFVKEIRELARNVSDISHRMTEDSENSRINQENDFSRILVRGNELNNTADRARDMVSENIKRIDDVMDLSLETLQRLESHSQRISGLVGDVVVAIQFHDIARQQIEHVMETLNDVNEMINEKGISGEKGEKDLTFLGKAHDILRLQTMQVEQTISEIMEAHRKITRAFEDIGSEIEALVDDVERIGLDKKGEGDQDSALRMLLSGFKRLEEIMANGEDLRGEIEVTMKRTKDSASHLSDYLTLIEDISTDLHIKSINALMMSRRLGKSGLTLSVLAQYVTEVSKESDGFVREVIDILKAIHSSAQELGFVSLKGDGASGDEDRIRTNLEDGIRYISDSYDKFLQRVDLSRNQSMELKKKITAIGSGLTFLAEMKEDLEKSLKEIEGLVERLSSFSSGNQRDREGLARVQSRYTMEIERGIHQRSTGSDNRGQGVEHMQKGDHELGENIELF